MGMGLPAFSQPIDTTEVILEELCGVGDEGESVKCRGVLQGGVHGDAQDNTSPQDSGIEYRKVSVPKVWAGSDGAPCVKIVEVWIPVDATPPIGPPDRFSVCPTNLLGDADLNGNSPAGPSLATPQSFAIEYWADMPLPSPQPYIAPGRAITGMYAYLETRGTTTHTYTEPNTPFGPLTIVATGRYYVDWGDGTRTGPHAGEGQPWPDGDIKHEYINIGAYDIVVTERWTATWSFGSESGVLDELRTVGTIEDFPVQQIQAVVLR
jgi:hypothetical protein